jgi:surface antigen
MRLRNRWVGTVAAKSAAMLLAAALLVAVVTLAGFVGATPARADTGGYPDANMPCEWFPQAVSGTAGTEWCDDFDWGPTPSTIFAGQESVEESTTISPRGFGYRNCTDYVAFELGITDSVVHGNAAEWKEQIAAADISSYPTVGAVAWWGSEVDQGFGHVAVVLAVQGNGSALIGEYNANLDGTYDTRVVSPHAVDAFLHIRDQAVPGGVVFSPPRPPAPTPVVHPSSPPSAVVSTPASPGPPASPAPPPGAAPKANGSLLAAGAARSEVAHVSFDVPSFIEAGTSQLVSARIDQTPLVAAALVGEQGPTATVAATPPAGASLVAALRGTGFTAVATTPAVQVVGSPGLWQWRVRPTGSGRRVLTLCLSVEGAGHPAVVASAPACAVSRSIVVGRVAPIPSWAAWTLAAIVLALAGGATGLLVRRRRPRA